MVRASLEIGNSNQELMGKPGRKKWRIWVAAVAIFVVIIILVAAAVVLLTGTGDANEPPSNPVTLQELMTGKLLANRFNGTWVSDDQLLYNDVRGNLMIHNVTSRSSKRVVNTDFPIMKESIDHQLSPDQKYMLFAFNYRKLYRHSYSAQYLVLNLETFESHGLMNTTGDMFIDLAIWGPQGNSIIYVYKSNLYYKESVEATPVKMTDTGVEGSIYNGVPDWVYEEEVFSSNKATWISDDGSHIAYATFDDTLTRSMTIPFYGLPGDVNSQYTRALSIRYPKAGALNPNVELLMVKTSNLSVHYKLTKPTKLHEPILASVAFATDSSVVAMWTNRVQNESIIVLCNPDCIEIFSYNEPRGWIDMLRPMIFTKDGNSFLTILPKEIKGDHWKQVALISNTGISGIEWSLKFITNSENTVSELVHFDKDAEILWYMATSAEDSAVQHLYKTDLKGNVECFTCKIKHSTGSDCLYNEILMSKDGGNIVVSCLGPQIPEVYTYSKTGEKLSDWDRNEDLAEFLDNKTLPTLRRMKVQVAEKPLPPAQVLLMTPPNADLSGNTKYPLLVNVYGGPDSYQVLEKWNLDWSATLVTRWNIIIAMIDGRGSGLKGDNNLYSIYRNLGTVEIDDQINVTRKLQHQLGYIDMDRSCIWGWSYGGYASALALARGDETFQCAISVAPVTDWALYDSIYTERYMGLPTPSDNLKGYERALVNTPEIASKINMKKFLLIHGTLDDNVHYQQSMMLSRVLQKYDVLFSQMSYPDEDHGLNGVKYHLYHTIEKFLETNLLSANDT